MSKKKGETDHQLKIAKVGISRTATVSEVARGVPPRLNLTVHVENPGDTPLHVWSSVQAFDYDAATHVLTVHLAERTVVPPKDFVIISEHPRAPAQVEVPAKGSTTLNIAVPGSVRRLTPGKGLNRSFEEDPVGQIDRIDINMQHGTEPIAFRPGEDPAKFRERLRAHGDVVQTSVTPTGDTKG